MNHRRILAGLALTYCAVMGSVLGWVYVDHLRHRA